MITIINEIWLNWIVFFLLSAALHGSFVNERGMGISIGLRLWERARKRVQVCNLCIRSNFLQQIIMIINSNLIRSMNFKWENIARCSDACIYIIVVVVVVGTQHYAYRCENRRHLIFLLPHFLLDIRIKDKSWFMPCFALLRFTSCCFCGVDHLMKLQSIYKIWLNWRWRIVPQQKSVRARAQHSTQ